MWGTADSPVCPQLLTPQAACCPPRPPPQGARLTAYELVHDGLPATLICDSAAAALMAQGRVDAVVVGADRIAANGDTGGWGGQRGRVRRGMGGDEGAVRHPAKQRPPTCCKRGR